MQGAEETSSCVVEVVDLRLLIAILGNSAVLVRSSRMLGCRNPQLRNVGKAGELKAGDLSERNTVEDMLRMHIIDDGVQASA